MSFIETVYWLAVLGAGYSYFGYPLLLLALSAVRRRPMQRADHAPPLTVIITAHNEEANIEGKILNTLEQDYPRDRLQIIVASDCSTDATDAIVSRYAGRGVDLSRADRRGGKEYAQMIALRRATGSVVAFSDVATILRPDALRLIARSFADPSVGCVSSEDRVLAEPGGASGEGGLRAL
ncbi:MAG: glycosyltransferase [Pseudomonadota bacterium]